MNGFGSGVINSGLVIRERNVYDSFTGSQYIQKYNNDLYFESLKSGKLNITLGVASSRDGYGWDDHAV